MSGLERLWAGWRNEFVNSVPSTGSNDSGSNDEDCVFCRILTSGQPDEETHVVWRHPGGRVLVLLNAYPYTSGHLMVMPVRHVGAIEELDEDESAAVWLALTDGIRALKTAYRPDGVNVGANLGKAAGAGVPGHFHLHVLPRWQGDTNFMTTVAETRVLPETLAVTDDRLRAAWPEEGRTHDH